MRYVPKEAWPEHWRILEITRIFIVLNPFRHGKCIHIETICTYDFETIGKPPESTPIGILPAGVGNIGLNSENIF